MKSLFQKAGELILPHLSPAALLRQIVVPGVVALSPQLVRAADQSPSSQNDTISINGELFSRSTLLSSSTAWRQSYNDRMAFFRPFLEECRRNATCSPTANAWLDLTDTLRSSNLDDFAKAQILHVWHGLTFSYDHDKANTQGTIHDYPRWSHQFLENNDYTLWQALNGNEITCIDSANLLRESLVAAGVDQKKLQVVDGKTTSSDGSEGLHAITLLTDNDRHYVLNNNFVAGGWALDFEGGVEQLETFVGGWDGGSRYAGFKRFEPLITEDATGANYFRISTEKPVDNLSAPREQLCGQDWCITLNKNAGTDIRNKIAKLLDDARQLGATHSRSQSNPYQTVSSVTAVCEDGSVSRIPVRDLKIASGDNFDTATHTIRAVNLPYNCTNVSVVADGRADFSIGGGNSSEALDSEGNPLSMIPAYAYRRTVFLVAAAGRDIVSSSIRSGIIQVQQREIAEASPWRPSLAGAAGTHKVAVHAKK